MGLRENLKTWSTASQPRLKPLTCIFIFSLMNTFTRVLFSLILLVPTQQHHYYLLPTTPLRLFLFNISLMVNLQVPVPAVLTVVLVADFMVVGGTTPTTVATIKERDHTHTDIYLHSYIKIVIVCNTFHHYIVHRPISINTKDGYSLLTPPQLIQNYLSINLTWYQSRGYRLVAFFHNSRNSPA